MNMWSSNHKKIREAKFFLQRNTVLYKEKPFCLSQICEAERCDLDAEAHNMMIMRQLQNQCLNFALKTAIFVTQFL